MATAQSVDDYISGLPEDVQPIIERIRQIVHEAAPGAEESIKYQMPAVTLGRRYAIYFAAWKRHVGLYPVPEGDAELERDLARYRSAKSTVKFPLNDDVPYELIERLVESIVAGVPDLAG